ncbi:MAG: glycosyltransferase family 2 protein [Thalassolituus sp.]
MKTINPTLNSEREKRSASNSVSIITPCYNASETLAKTITSVQQQDFEDWELIIVDDQSSDTTYKTALKFSEIDPRIKVIQQNENAGAAKARNRGIEIAQGRFIAFIDADDQWATNKLSRQLAMMLENQWPISYTAYTRHTSDGTIINAVGVPKKITYRDLLKTNVIGCSTAIYDSQILGKIYMPDLRKRQDYGLWLRILRKTPYAYGINSALTLYLVQQNSLSANKKKSALYNWHIYRNEEKLSLLSSWYNFVNYAFRGAIRTNLPNLAYFIGLLEKPDRD